MDNTKNQETRPLFLFLLMKAESFAAVCLPVWDTRERDAGGATVHVTLCVWRLWGLEKGVAFHVCFWRGDVCLLMVCSRNGDVHRYAGLPVSM